MAVFSFAHRRHSGKKLHHGQTSYATLAFLLMLTGVILTGYSASALAATVPKAQNPQDGSVGLIGAVRGPAPNQAAIIKDPSNGFRLTASPITVSGTCPAKTFVSIFRNNVFSGIAICQDDGTFSMLVDLLAGQNQLQTKVSDALGQSGPDSNIVTVNYVPSVFAGSNANATNPLFLVSQQGVIGVSPGQNLQRTVTISGGFGPYAVSWDFGDGTVIAIPQTSPGEASASHIYGRPGTYSVIVRVTDSNNNTAIIQLVTVVNGPVTGIASTHNKLDIPGALAGAWPLYLLAVMMVVVFWLGERRELWEVRRHPQLLA